MIVLLTKEKVQIVLAKNILLILNAVPTIQLGKIVHPGETKRTGAIKQSGTQENSQTDHIKLIEGVINNKSIAFSSLD